MHPVDPEVPRRTSRAQQLGKRQDEPAQARVHVAVGVDGRAAAAMAGIGSTTPCGYAGRADDQDRVRADISHRVDVGGPVERPPA